MAAIASALVAPVVASRSVSLKPARAAKAASFKVSNGSTVKMMQVVNPFTNIKYETMSYLPLMTDSEMAKQVDFMVKSGWAPCIEFDSAANGFVTRKNLLVVPGYYDNRYWVMYKLPMFGCTDPSQVLVEINNCKKEFPNAFIRVCAFDNVRQVQVASFIVAKPKGY